MPNKNEPDKQDLIRRRNEILRQMDRLKDDLQMELERDPEEQAIQIEQDQVAISMEDNLREELADIERKLEEMGETF